MLIQGKRKWPGIGIAVLAVMALGVPGANADLVLTLNDLDSSLPGVEVIIADGQGVGYVTSSGMTTTHADVNPVVGQLTFIGPVGGGSIFTANVSTGTSKPLLGPHPEIDLSSVNLSSVGTAGSLVIGLTDTGFAGSLLPLAPWSAMNSVGGVSGGVVDISWSMDESDLEFGIGSIGTPMQGPFGIGSFAGDSAAPGFTSPLSFSLSQWVTIMHGSGIHNSSFNSTVIIPTPGAALLGVAGLGVLGLLRRRLG